MMPMRSLQCAAVVLVLLWPWEPAPALAASSSAPGARRRYDSIFSLGDSFTDTGNNPAVFAWYSIPDPVTRPPYGTTFFGRPTGRNCDGRLIIDFIAEALGLPYVPPYLGPPFGSPPPPPATSFRRGASLAVGGATALDAGFFRSRGLLPAPSKFPLNASLSVQLEWFESRLKPSLCRTTQECEELFGRSLFFVGEFGVNDYLFSFGKMSLQDIRSVVVPSIVETIRQAIERLIKHGAKALVVPGVIPLGCSPPVLFLFPEADPAGYDARTGCMLKHNEVGRHHNAALQESLKDLRAKHPGVSIIYADFFGPVMDMVQSPRKLGFREDVLSVCCGGHGRYNYNISVPCGDANATTCSRPSASIYWDGVHFTEAANRHISSTWLSSIS
ncbi:GDSL esterase/lipase [Panicum miliaceum]|uniref:GDSL esterase/lipase n=1 Tax=Panicum miliaceum TaxID=4540 RepID=A0A3L6QYC3_PANMI|nr:GDSL esterase/lipase [Panicum miliaceum]